MTHTASEIRINGEPAPLPADTVGELLRHLGIDPARRRGIAVALNGGLVPRGRWDTAPVRPGDDLEIIGATQGG